MVENVVFPDLQDLSVEKCQQLCKENQVIIANLEAAVSADPALAIQIELLKRENALLAALEKALAGRRGGSNGTEEGNGSAQYGQ